MRIGIEEEVCHLDSRTAVLKSSMQKIIMKLTKIFGIVLSLHVGVILLVMFQPSCQTADKKKSPTSQVENASEEMPLDGFNQGVEAPAEPLEEAFVAPSRPKPGEIIIPGNDIIVPLPESVSPSAVTVEPSFSPLRPMNVSIYVVVRGDTLWGIARKNSITLNSLLASNPSLSKDSKLSIGQEIMIQSGGALTSTVPASSPQSVVTADVSSGTYVIMPGDNLSRIARKNQVSLASLMEVNGLNSLSIIRPGQTLIIPDGSITPLSSTINTSTVPPGAITHMVKRGENLTRISKIYGVSIAQIMSWNDLSDPGKIRVGQSLVVSGEEGAESQSRTNILSTEDPESVPAVSDSKVDDSLQNFFKGTTEDRPLIDAPENP